MVFTYVRLVLTALALLLQMNLITNKTRHKSFEIKLPMLLCLLQTAVDHCDPSHIEKVNKKINLHFIYSSIDG